MKQQDILISHITDLKERCADNSVITFTNFLTVDEVNLVKQNERTHSKYIDTFLFGGYDNAERVVAFFVPRFYDVDDISSYLLENIEDNPIVAIDIKKDKFSSLSHRDYLGALMALGIKREMLGDIIVKDDGCYIFCLKSVSEFILQNLKSIGRGTVSCVVCQVLDLDNDFSNVTEEKVSVTSLRIDNYLSSVYNMSRTQSAEYIRRDNVFINSTLCTKVDYVIKPGDKIVLRGKGKTIFKDVVGKSKKGRLYLSLNKYN